jgi:hypothetical protein
MNEWMNEWMNDGLRAAVHSQLGDDNGDAKHARKDPDVLLPKTAQWTELQLNRICF